MTHGDRGHIQAASLQRMASIFLMRLKQQIKAAWHLWMKNQTPCLSVCLTRLESGFLELMALNLFQDTCGNLG